MGTTATTVNLMWSPSEDNVGVDHYIVYRESAGVMNKIGTAANTSFMDKDLKANTSYKYVVTAVDLAGNESSRSDVLNVTTKLEDSAYEKWDARKAYTKGDRVVHEGKCTKRFKIIKEMATQIDFCFIALEASFE